MKETEQKKSFDIWYKAIRTIVRYGECEADGFPAEILEAIQEANIYSKDLTPFEAVSTYYYVKKRRTKPSKFA